MTRMCLKNETFIRAHGAVILIMAMLSMASARTASAAQGGAAKFLGPSKPLVHVQRSKVRCLNQVVESHKDVNIDGPLPEENALLIKKFFGCFPDTWNEFHSMFGFSEKTNELGPFSNNEGQILISDILPMARKVVGNSAYETRLIKIAMEARPQNFADGATDMNGAFFTVVYNEIKSHPKSMIDKLNFYDKSSLQRFWFWVLIWKNYRNLESNVCLDSKLEGTRACEAMRVVIERYSSYLESH